MKPSGLKVWDHREISRTFLSYEIIWKYSSTSETVTNVLKVSGNVQKPTGKDEVILKYWDVWKICKPSRNISLETVQRVLRPSENIPNSYVMVQYKTFGLKHYIVFLKKNPPTGQITFWPTPLKIEISKYFYHRHVGCLSRGIDGISSKINFFSYPVYAVFEKSNQQQELDAVEAIKRDWFQSVDSLDRWP